MRTHRHLVEYGSVLDALLEAGCPFCRVLKDFQASRLQSRARTETRSLCNFHAWGLAAVQDAVSAADVFIGLVDRSHREVGEQQSVCSICEEVLTEEDLRMGEFAGAIRSTQVSRWLNSNPALCSQHGVTLKKRVPIGFAVHIEEVMANTRRTLVIELKHLRDEHATDRSGWGVLGRAAEFLVAQRGLKS